MQFVAQHGNDLLFWWHSTPIDVTNRVSLVLVLAAILGSRHWAPARRWALWFGVLLGSTMVLGPYLRWEDALLTWNDEPITLPFQWLRSLHPTMARLTWPERWGILIPLGLVALAARAPRPWLFGLGVVVESFLLSGNLPVLTTSVQHERCWSKLASASGAVLELPLRRGGLRASRVGLHQRFHGRPVVNPVLLPPGVKAPDDWNRWMRAQPFVEYLREFEQGRWPADPGADAIRAFRNAGVSVLALDVEPGGVLSQGGTNRYKAGLTRHLGAPIDLGCALVWWMDGRDTAPEGVEDGDAWRISVARYKELHPNPPIDALIQPLWDVRETSTGDSAQ